MPDTAMHHAFGQDVKSELPEAIRHGIMDEPYGFALYGPDIWFMYRFWRRRGQGRGRRMHTTKTGDFLIALAKRSRDGKNPGASFSYLAGFLCHYALDSTAHPYIIWRTTETWPTRRAHRDLEHALDIHLMQKEGTWGGKHPLTDHHFPKLRLSREMEEDMDAAYGQVYGWRGTVDAMNRCYAIYRMVFRELEKPRSMLTLASRLVSTPGMRSLPHAASAFVDLDVENMTHAPWKNPFAPEETRTESFPELYEEAKREAVRMIGDCYAFARTRSLTEEELRQSLGNRSYFSGLDAEDPRNRAVPSLCPPD